VKHPGGGPVTVADVRAFIAINGFAASANGKTTNGTMPVVLQATLMTAQQASALMHGEWPGRPSTAPVIFVELQGPFIMEVTAPPEYKLPIAQKGQELFDATTGDLIVFGGG